MRRLKISNAGIAALVDSLPVKNQANSTLAKRLLVGLILVPISVAFIWWGSWFYILFISGVLGFASWEYWRMFKLGGYKPSAFVLIPGVILLSVTRGLWAFQYQDAVLAFLIIFALVVYLWHYEHGLDTPATNYAITIGGLLYIGWLGSYALSLRDLPNGVWWALIAFPAVASADAGAFFLGGRLGKHSMTHRVSPNKTWEGYAGGVLVGTLFGWLLAALWHLREPSLLPLQGLLLSFVVTSLAPLGDLAESMIKRQFNIKDSSHIFPGHGGMMDRIDTLIYAAAIGYYLILLF